MLLLNLSYIPWVPGRLKRNQALFTHLLRAGEPLAAGVFVNPPRIAPPPFAKYAAPARLELAECLELAGKPVAVVQPVYSLPHWRLPFLARRWAAEIVEALRRQYLSGREYALWMNCAGKLHAELVRLLAPAAARTVFDSSDDFTSWEPPSYHARLGEVLQQADVVTCVNDHVAATIDHPRKITFRNCTDFENFQTADPGYRRPPLYPKPAGAVYIGFIGGINATRADRGLLERLFVRFPGFQFLFVGYSDHAALVDSLVRRPNVHFVNEVPYRELPNVIRGFDVAIVPHLDNAVTRGNDLLKVLDYFACGVPVVTTRCSGVEEYRRALYIADSPGEFGDCIEQLVCGSRRHDPEPGYCIARERSWTVQAPGLARAVFDNTPARALTAAG